VEKRLDIGACGQ